LRILALCSAIFLLACTSFVSADSLDDLLSVPDETLEGAGEEASDFEPITGYTVINQEAVQSEDSIDVDDLLSSDQPVIAGNYSARLGGRIGFRKWPESLDLSGLADQTEADLLASSDLSISLDIRPRPYFSVYISAGTELDPSTLAYSNPEIDFLYLDYLINGKTQIRLGIQPLNRGWGQLLGNTGNILTEAADGFAFKVDRPIGNHNLSLLAYSNERLLGFDGLYRIGSAMAMDFSFDQFAAGIAGSFTYNLPISFSAYIKNTLAGVDIINEAVVRYDWFGPVMETPIEIDHLVRLAYEHAPTDTLALFEYRIGIDFADEIDVSNRAALAVLFNGTRMLGWRPGFQVRHDFEDIAGEVSFAINRRFCRSWRLMSH
jgi:hypothetical protein